MFTSLEARERNSSVPTSYRIFGDAPPESPVFADIVTKSNLTVEALRPVMNGLRVMKSESEIANMRLAGKISGRAFTKAMAGARCKSEKALQTNLEHGFQLGGCGSSAYVPVVAGGEVITLGFAVWARAEAADRPS